MSLSEVLHITGHAVIGRQFLFEFVDNDSDLFKSGQSDLNGLQPFDIEGGEAPDPIPLLQDFVQLGLFFWSLFGDLVKQIFDLINFRFMALNIGLEFFMSNYKSLKGLNISWEWSFANLDNMLFEFTKSDFKVGASVVESFGSITPFFFKSCASFPFVK